MPNPYRFVRYSLGKWWPGGRGKLMFKILKAFLFYYCVHSANINQKLYFGGRGGGIFCATDAFF